MISGFPYYPSWRKRTEDRRRFFHREKYKGIDLFRGYLYVPKKVTTIKRIFHEFTFSFFALLNFVRIKRPDIIVVFTPPILLGAVALLFKCIWRCPLVINVQDIPLDAAMQLGMVRRGAFMRIALWLEVQICKKCDFVTTISSGMRASLEQKGVDSRKIGIIPNWIDVAAATKIGPKGSFLGSHPQAQGKFIAIYAGNIGKKQGVDILLRLAESMIADTAFHFFVIGDGADKPRLLALAHRLSLNNVTFLSFLERERYREMLRDIDVVFVAQRGGVGNIFFPSKILGIMAQAKPMLVAADLHSELAITVGKAECGLVCGYDDIVSMRSLLLRMHAEPELLRRFGENGSKHVLMYDRAVVLGGLEAKLTELIGKCDR